MMIKYLYFVTSNLFKVYIEIFELNDGISHLSGVNMTIDIVIITITPHDGFIPKKLISCINMKDVTKHSCTLVCDFWSPNKMFVSLQSITQNLNIVGNERGEIEKST